MAEARDRLLTALEAAGCRLSNGGSASTCPAHDDSAPSLSIGARRDGTGVLVRCHAGCDTADVLAALSMTAGDLFDEPQERRARSEVVASYRYVDESGALLYEKVRLVPKSFRQRCPDGSGGWSWKLGDTRRVLYRLPEVVAAVEAGSPVYVAEGEKDADALACAGVAATTWTEGAWQHGSTPKWRPDYTRQLAGAHVVIVRDRDEPGAHTAATIAGLLEPVAASVRVVEPAEGKDAHDHLAAGRRVDELVPVTARESSPAIEGDTAAADDAVEAALTFNRAVHDEAERLRVREAARDVIAREKAGEVTLPALVTLDAFLGIPDEAVTHRVAGLWPSGGRVVFTASHKAGKSTAIANLIRALVDGADFLGQFDVEQARRVVLVDAELDERMLRRWLRAQGVRNTQAVTVIALRGKASTFDLLDPATRTRWAQHIGPADVLILDCLRPVLDALRLSEDKEAGVFLEALDELTAEAGIPECVVVHHMGHGAERSRGDSRILDWPDAVWKLVKDAESEGESTAEVPRYFTAYGRDVDQPEARLSFDPDTRRLTVAGGTRSDRRSDEALPDVLDVLAAHPEGLSGRAVEATLKDTDHGRDVIRAALARAKRERLTVVETGPRNAKIHRLNPGSDPSARECAGVREAHSGECASALYRSAHSPTHSQASEQEDIPAHSLDEPRCTDCARRLGRSDTEHGVCIACRRIRKANDRSAS